MTKTHSTSTNILPTPFKGGGKMFKTIYILRSPGHGDYHAFSRRIKQVVGQVLEHNPTITLRYTITDQAPPTFSIIPFSKKKIAVISVYSHYQDTVDVLKNAEGFAGAYRVEEALPTAYSKNWPDGAVTPGACLLTLFSKKKSIDHSTFIDRWHNNHTPLSLRYHPLWNYNRNVVLENVVDGSKSFDGIVEEQFRTKSELLNPFKFFGNPLVITQRMINVYLDTKSFIDYPSMETFLANEYVVKSGH